MIELSTLCTTRARPIRLCERSIIFIYTEDVGKTV